VRMFGRSVSFLFSARPNLYRVMDSRRTQNPVVNLPSKPPHHWSRRSICAGVVPETRRCRVSLTKITDITNLWRGIELENYYVLTIPRNARHGGSILPSKNPAVFQAQVAVDHVESVLRAESASVGAAQSRITAETVRQGEARLRDEAEPLSNLGGLRHKLRPPLLANNLELLILHGRQDRFHLRVRRFVYRPESP
jgi:hypothetical protein